MATFTLKANDTRPILEVSLRNPDGTAHDLTGSTAWKLNVRLTPTVVFTRDLVKQGLDTAGTLRYSWVAADWEVELGDGNLPIPTDVAFYNMEYEVVGGTSRMTFPNNSYDTLKILRDVV